MRYISSNNMKILWCNIAPSRKYHVLKPYYQISDFGEVKSCSLVDIFLLPTMDNHKRHTGLRLPALQYNILPDGLWVEYS